MTAPGAPPPAGATPPGWTALPPAGWTALPPAGLAHPGLSPAGLSPTAVPPPPPGPGVQPPFVAPPTDGTRQRRWLALGLAGAAVLICCVGGLFGVGGLVVFGTQMVVDEARTAVHDYLTAIRDDNFDAAYDLLCDARREQVTKPQFVDSVSTWDYISFEVGQPQIDSAVTVPATLRFADHTSEDVRFYLNQDRKTGDFKVCGQQG
jgi:hypothetical protein